MEERKGNLFRIINLGRASEDQTHGFHQYTQPALSLLLVQDRNELIILPNAEPLKQMKTFFEETLWDGQTVNCIFSDKQYYSIDAGISNDDGLFEEIKKQLSFFVKAEGTIDLISFAPTPEIEEWTKCLPYKVVHNFDSALFRKKYSSKNIFHRLISEPDKPALIEHLPLRIPRGYVAQSQKEIVVACEKLSSEGVDNILAKPSNQSAGIGIKDIRSNDDIEGLSTDVEYLLEEKLVLDEDAYGKKSNCGVAFHDNQVFGVWRQLLNGDAYMGAIYPFGGADTLNDDILRQIHTFKDFMITKGMKKDGGIDFIISNNQAFLVDNNLGRMTGTHSAIFFQRRYVPDTPFAYFDLGKLGLGVFEVWEILRQKNVALDIDRKLGVFPVCWMPNICAEMIAFAPTPLDAYELMSEMRTLFT